MGAYSHLIHRTKTEIIWRGDPWALWHAINFYRTGKWTLAFAAYWLCVEPNDLYNLATKPCDHCNGKGVVWREIPNPTVKEPADATYSNDR